MKAISIYISITLEFLDEFAAEKGWIHRTDRGPISQNVESRQQFVDANSSHEYRHIVWNLYETCIGDELSDLTDKYLVRGRHFSNILAACVHNYLNALVYVGPKIRRPFGIEIFFLPRELSVFCNAFSIYGFLLRMRRLVWIEAPSTRPPELPIAGLRPRREGGGLLDQAPYPLAGSPARLAGHRGGGQPSLCCCRFTYRSY